MTAPPQRYCCVKSCRRPALPRDGLITQSTRKAVTAGALFCFVEKPT
ncbi:TPA: hypothetical protein G8K37_004630, partial [Salmonella enterica]|nr:hypothetical protein [Salmonella enterica]